MALRFSSLCLLSVGEEVYDLGNSDTYICIYICIVLSSRKNDCGPTWWAVGILGYSGYSMITWSYTHTHYSTLRNYSVSHILTSCCVSFRRPEGKAELFFFDMQRKHLTEWAAVWGQCVIKSYSLQTHILPVPYDLLHTFTLTSLAALVSVRPQMNIWAGIHSLNFLFYIFPAVFYFWTSYFVDFRCCSDNF